MDHLSAKGISCPTPVHARNGEALGELAGRPAAIHTFLDGMWIRKPRVDHCAALGTALAEMHLAGRDFALRRENALTVEHWPALFAQSSDRADGVMKGLSGIIERELDELGRRWPSGLPDGVIHADLFPDNVFFLRERLSGLIDFYFACNDLFAYDVAICLNAWCFETDLSFNVTKARALLNGYTTIRAFTSEEYAALPLLARGAALRFLLTRLYDWLTVPEDALVTPKDPIEYLKKLRFHQTVTSARDYGLD